MPTWIALFRGINVGGNNLLPMAKLRSDLETLGLKKVRSYIQSGNVVFESPSKTAKPLTAKITKMIADKHGFQPTLILLSPDQLQSAVDENPFPDAIEEPKTLHFSFLSQAPSKPDLEALEKIKSPTESFELTPRIFYLWAPEGIGRSKLAGSAEKHLGVAMTGRNYRTVSKLLSMLSE